MFRPPYDTGVLTADAIGVVLGKPLAGGGFEGMVLGVRDGRIIGIDRACGRDLWQYVVYVEPKELRVGSAGIDHRLGYIDLRVMRDIRNRRVNGHVSVV